MLLVEEKYANPCGLVALSFFNDTYSITKAGEEDQTWINDTGIAWRSDKEKFMRGPNSEQD